MASWRRWALFYTTSSLYELISLILCCYLGDDQSILTREIVVIEELAEVEPDCKCELSSGPYPRELNGNLENRVS